LLPVLDGASVEDEETPHSMWANILCTAAIPGSKPKPYSAFIEVLKQMSTEEVVFYNALYDDLERRRAEYSALPKSERAAVKFPQIPDGYELIYTYLRANGYAQEAGSPEEAHNRYECEVDVSLENLTRLGLLGDAIEPGSTPERLRQKLLECNGGLETRLKEALSIDAAFGRTRTTTTAFGDMFAAVCRHPEWFTDSNHK
jgi:hypothetical protein